MALLLKQLLQALVRCLPEGVLCTFPVFLFVVPTGSRFLNT